MVVPTASTTGAKINSANRFFGRHRRPIAPVLGGIDRGDAGLQHNMMRFLGKAQH